MLATVTVPSLIESTWSLAFLLSSATPDRQCRSEKARAFSIAASQSTPNLDLRSASCFAPLMTWKSQMRPMREATTLASQPPSPPSWRPGDESRSHTAASSHFSNTTLPES